jgi:2-methylcitrate dehydratase PrpD
MAATDATDLVAEFIVDTPTAAIPDAAREAGLRALFDTVGVVLAGVVEPSAEAVRDLLVADEGANGAGPASVLGTSLRASLAGAALANGTAGHALDFDDVTQHMTGHPSIPLAPAVLAIAEERGASGAELLTAFLIGFEAECKIGRAMGRSHYARGFHATSTLGALGSAASCARLLGLSREETVHALGIASSLAGGLRANFGSMTKPLQAGNAARAGVVATGLAQRGFTGGESILDGPFGFVRTFSPDDDGDLEQIGGFGDPWEVLDPGVSVKKYPCCFVSHRAADAALTLAEEHDLHDDQIERIEVHLPGGQVSSTGGVGAMIHARPTTGLQGKFSMQYVVASAIHDRALTFATFEDEAVMRPELQTLLRRVEPVNDTTRHPAAEADNYLAVEVYRQDGAVLTHALTEPRGGPSDPLSWDELADKFRDCAARALPAPQVERAIELLRNLDAIADTTEVVAALRA